MSISDRDPNPGGRAAAPTLLARAAAADLRADRRLTTAIDDIFLGDDGRLDDRARAALATTLESVLGAIEAAIRMHAARLLTARAQPRLAELIADGVSALDRLRAAGLLRDPELMHELIGRVRQGLIADALPIEPPGRADQPSLLARLSRHADQRVARAAVALLAAEGHRKAPILVGAAPRGDLPAPIHRRLAWWIAAALRARPASGDIDALDRALAEAAQHSIAAYDENDRLEAVATRLAAALDAGAEELAALLGDALADQRLSLFIALLGHALGLAYADVRDLVLEPDGERLWLVLRALELDRAAIAAIGVALCEADPRRDIERFAETLDTIAAIEPERARAAVAPLTLPPEYRAAMVAVARGTWA
ncbi:DUF2336 domain-containing protein [Sphingomonas sp. H39-1-10]|uniref:DUF2336 domain-containing protein n=1 Tax=Sphingomonas pollutisoli TaxID=3030829 RepID=UPI0023B998C4|nr:DUF2336 domain-containing protein [Sphingomonas pollutisoli]MDF0488983.1 DUF2336 domain-containing protein [Sphingomonas pollutisoli]